MRDFTTILKVGDKLATKGGWKAVVVEIGPKIIRGRFHAVCPNSGQDYGGGIFSSYSVFWDRSGREIGGMTGLDLVYP